MAGVPSPSMPVAVPSIVASAPCAQRDRCSFCGVQADPHRVESALVPSNVRQFKSERFRVWRCARCRSLHCLEVVELGRYYADYPIARTLSAPARVALDNLRSHLTRHGFSPRSTLLDYGCGSGLFGARARECGFPNVVGYDPYSPIDEFRDPACLRPESFDYILLQDVLEHVEDPRVLLADLDRYLRPGGSILVGTPNADEITLHPYEKCWLELHPPYHLHIYTAGALRALAAEVGWREAEFSGRSYYDTKAIGLNMQALAQYQSFGDGTLNALSERVARRRLVKSPRFMFLALFGYWFRRKGDMTVIFNKPVRSSKGTSHDPAGPANPQAGQV
jgi:2-polyprenyl-3-methyl-5-hydroxy-6-metoxy-1,4-benzoquinol methylase